MRRRRCLSCYVISAIAKNEMLKVFMNGLTKDSLTAISIAAHVLRGCDSVPKLYGIGKAKAINALKSVSLSVFGNPESSENEYVDDAKRFIARCYV